VSPDPKHALLQDPMAVAAWLAAILAVAQILCIASLGSLRARKR
jgi:hypothetical protein